MSAVTDHALGSEPSVSDSEDDVANHSFSPRTIAKAAQEAARAAAIAGGEQTNGEAQPAAPKLTLKLPARQTAAVGRDQPAIALDPMTGPSVQKATSSTRSSASDRHLEQAHEQLDAASDADDSFEEGQEATDSRWNKAKKGRQPKAAAKKASAPAAKGKGAAVTLKRKRPVVPDESEEEDADEPGGPVSAPAKPKKTKSQAAAVKAANSKQTAAKGRKTNNSASTATFLSKETVDSEEDAPTEAPPAAAATLIVLPHVPRPTNKVRPEPSVEPEETAPPLPQARGKKKRGRDSAVDLPEPSSSVATSPPAAKVKAAAGTRIQATQSPATTEALPMSSARRSSTRKATQAAATCRAAASQGGDDAISPARGKSAATQVKGRQEAKAAASSRRQQQLVVEDSEEDVGSSQADESESESEAEEEQPAAKKKKQATVKAAGQAKKASTTGKGKQAAAAPVPPAEPDRSSEIPLQPEKTSGDSPSEMTEEQEQPAASTSQALVVASKAKVVSTNKVGKIGQGKAANPNSLAAIISRTVPVGIRRPGLSKSQRIPSLHRNIAPPPAKKALPSTAKRWDSDDDGEEVIGAKEKARRRRVDDGDESPTEEDIRRGKREERARNNGWKG